MTDNRRTSTKAAIKRATRSAQTRLRSIDAEALAGLEAIYRRAADQIRGDIDAAAGGDSVRISSLQTLLRQVRARMAALKSGRDGLLALSLDSAANVGADVWAADAATVRTPLYQVAADAVNFVRNLVADDGLQLSDRIWRIDRHADRAVTESIEQAVIQGDSASRAVQDLLTRGEQVPDDLMRKIDMARGDRVQTLASDALMTGPGTPYDNARRLFRTEINRAHGEAYKAAAFKHPDVIGTRFMLSPNHPRPDVCFRRGTAITSASGPVAIEQIREGDTVLTHTGAWREVTRIYRRFIPAGSDIVRLSVRTESGQCLRAVMTPNHPVRSGKEWIPAGDLRTGFPVAVFSGSSRSHRSVDGACDTGSSGSRESSPVTGRGSSGERECGEAPIYRDHRRPGSDRSRAQEPTFSHTSGSNTCRGSLLRPSSSDSLPLDGSGKDAHEPPSNGETCSDGVCRNSGCSHPRQSTGDCNRSSRGLEEQIDFRTSGTSWCGTEPNSISEQETRSGNSPHSDGMSSQSLSHIRNGVISSIERLASDGEEVFNLEVEDDHSYVAAGIVVHNCDMHARVDRYGLGPGVYPPGKSPWPAHPNTMSFEEAVFSDEVDSAGSTDRIAWLKDQPADVQESVLGKGKAQLLRDGTLSENEINTPWKVLKKRYEIDD